MLDFLTLQTTTPNATIVTVLYTVLISLLLSIMIGFTYEKTFRGLSYSRNFVQALILSSVITAMVMQAIGDSLARGLGMIGALAIIRFRTNFKDPRDIIFMFAALGSGISIGVGAYSTGVICTIGFCLMAALLYNTSFGQSRNFDGLLRFSIASDTPGGTVLESVLKQYCKVFALVTLREVAQGKRLDYAYQIKLKKGIHNAAIIDAMKKIETIEGISLMLQETTVEL